MVAGKVRQGLGFKTQGKAQFEGGFLVSELNPMPCYVLAAVAVFHSSKIVRNHVQGKARLGLVMLDCWLAAP
jgi:hypothetical protein